MRSLRTGSPGSPTAASARDRVLVVDASGLLADPSASDDAKRERLAALFVDASPSPTSMRSGPEYRLAMLRVLGLRAVHTAIERLAAA